MEADKRLCVILVGLPARGKTFIARKIARYFNWLGIQSSVFNVGNYRRKLCGTALPSSFYSPDNQEAVNQRNAAAMACLDDLITWLLTEDGSIKDSSLRDGLMQDSQSQSTLEQHQNCQKVAIYDATNTTEQRRSSLIQKLKENQIGAMIIESICTDDAVILENIQSVKYKNNPDYQEASFTAAITDFEMRIKNYEKTYETVDPCKHPDIPVVKLIDLGRRLVD